MAIPTNFPNSSTPKQRSALDGVSFGVMMNELGYQFIPTMGIGTGCQVHLKAGELPEKGRFVVSLSRHCTAVVDGVIHDTSDPSRGGKRCVYGYWRK